MATDFAARGLDIPTVSHVFNYDLPENVDDYVHRAEGTGFAFSLMVPEDIDLYNALEQQVGQETFTWASHPGFDYLNEPKESQQPDRDRRGRAGSHRTGRNSRGANRPRRTSNSGSDSSTVPPLSDTPPKNPFGRRRSRPGRQ